MTIEYTRTEQSNTKRAIDEIIYNIYNIYRSDYCTFNYIHTYIFKVANFKYLVCYYS